MTPARLSVAIIGAGIQMMPNSMKVLRAIGIEARVRGSSNRARKERELEGGGALHYRRPGGHRGLATRLFDLLMRTAP